MTASIAIHLATFISNIFVPIVVMLVSVEFLIVVVSRMMVALSGAIKMVFRHQLPDQASRAVPGKHSLQRL